MIVAPEPTTSATRNWSVPLGLLRLYALGELPTEAFRMPFWIELLTS